MSKYFMFDALRQAIDEEMQVWRSKNLRYTNC